jgi:hypothetical protein
MGGREAADFLETASITYVPDGPNTIGFWHYKLDQPEREVQASRRSSNRSLIGYFLDGAPQTGPSRTDSPTGVTAKPPTVRPRNSTPSRN